MQGQSERVEMTFCFVPLLALFFFVTGACQFFLSPTHIDQLPMSPLPLTNPNLRPETRLRRPARRGRELHRALQKQELIPCIPGIHGLLRISPRGPWAMGLFSTTSMDVKTGACKIKHPKNAGGSQQQMGETFLG